MTPQDLDDITLYLVGNQRQRQDHLAETHYEGEVLLNEVRAIRRLEELIKLCISEKRRLSDAENKG